MSQYEQAKKLGIAEAHRWLVGTPHHKMSTKLMDFLKEHDCNEYHDHFDWKLGGDGDNGEILMYQMDAFFESLDYLNSEKRRSRGKPPENPDYQKEREHIKNCDLEAAEIRPGSLAHMRAKHPEVRKARLLEYCDLGCISPQEACRRCPIEKEVMRMEDLIKTYNRPYVPVCAKDE